MKSTHLTALLTAGLVALAPLVRAQPASEDEAARRAEEKARQKAEQQMREAEQEMKEAQRKPAGRAPDARRRPRSRDTLRSGCGASSGQMVVFGDHPRIGVILRSAPTRESTSLAPMPGLTLPAEEAGIQVGDVVVDQRQDPDDAVHRCRGRRRRVGARRQAAGGRAGVMDGDPVELVVKRAGELKSVKLAARR